MLMHNNYNTFLVSHVVTDKAKQKSLKIMWVFPHTVGAALWYCRVLWNIPMQQHIHLTTVMLLAMCCTLSSPGSTTEGNNNHVSTTTDLCVKHNTPWYFIQQRSYSHDQLVKRSMNITVRFMELSAGLECPCLSLSLTQNSSIALCMLCFQVQ